jgi:hypothetical protein
MADTLWHIQLVYAYAKRARQAGETGLRRVQRGSGRRTMLDYLSLVVLLAAFGAGYAVGRQRSRQRVREAERRGYLKLYRAVDGSWL